MERVVNIRNFVCLVTLLIFLHSLHLSALLNVSISVISSTLHRFLRAGIVSLTFVVPMFLFYFIFYLFFCTSALSHLPDAMCYSCTLCCMCSWQIMMMMMMMSCFYNCCNCYNSCLGPCNLRLKQSGKQSRVRRIKRYTD